MKTGGLSDRRGGSFVFSGAAMEKDRIAIIGLGKVGSALGFLLRSAGHDIVAVSDCSAEALRSGILYTGGLPCTDAASAAAHADSVFITTTDDAIKTVCDEMAGKGVFSPGKRVVHASGAGGLDLLEAARQSGAYVASIHPLQSFADVRGAIENIPGSTFGITAQKEIESWTIQIVRDLGGTFFFVPDEDKPLYHVAACIASNYLVTLIYIVRSIHHHLGLRGDDAVKSFWPLVRGTINNIEHRGVEHSLTGPIARGDVGTIEKHLAAIDAKLPWLSQLYREMGIFTTRLGLENDLVSDQKARAIISLLKGTTPHE